MFSPAGFEGFFRDLTEADKLGKADGEGLVRLFTKYCADLVD